MGKLFNLKASNGECIADFGDISTRLRLHCVEELGDGGTSNKNYTSVWIPVNTKRFWKLIKEVCDRNTEHPSVGDNTKNELKILSEVIGKLIEQLED